MYSSWPIFSILRWQDLLDIAIISYLLFRFYVLFRGTNVFRILIAIVFLWVFQRLAVFLGLIVTSWAIQGVTAVAAIIIIVVFREEIRSVFQAKNLRSIIWGLRRIEVNTPIEIITESAFELASRYIGALIVLPGKEDLKEVVHSGIPWQGLVSKEMVMSIFWSDNPVHDGAAIFQGDRITEVGVVLPLSRQEDLPSYYGTRHRAAAGLAESTDALVIVVSEERGEVLAAKGNMIRVITDREELTEILREHAGLPTTPEGAYKGETLGLGLAAAASILLVTGLWFSFTRGLDTLITLKVPVEYMNRDVVMEIVNTSANTVELTLGGSGPLIKSVRPGQVMVRINLAEATVGSSTYPITPENVTLPPGVFFKGVEPEEVQVTLDIPITMELPVQVDWIGKLPEHLIMTKVTLEPAAVKIIGGSQILQNISTIYTEKIALDNINKSGMITVKPVLSPASLKISSNSDDKIKVFYVLKERAREPSQEQ